MCVGLRICVSLNTFFFTLFARLIHLFCLFVCLLSCLTHFLIHSFFLASVSLNLTSVSIYPRHCNVAYFYGYNDF